MTKRAEKGSAEKGGSVVAARIREIRVGLGIKSQRALSDLMAEAAKRNGGVSGYFDQTYVSRIETGEQPATTPHIHTAYAAALGLTLDEWSAYVAGTMSIATVKALRSERAAAAAQGGTEDLAASPSGGEAPHPTYRQHPRWHDLIEEAREIRQILRDETFDLLGDAITWGPPGALTGPLLADIADTAQRWADAGRRMAKA